MTREGWIVVLVLGGLVAAATLVGAVVLATRVVRTRRLLGELGMSGKLAFYGALVYTVLPVDLLPDPIYLDDMGILAGALFFLTRLVRQHRAGQAGADQVTRPPTDSLERARRRDQDGVRPGR